MSATPEAPRPKMTRVHLHLLDEVHEGYTMDTAEELKVIREIAAFVRSHVSTPATPSTDEPSLNRGMTLGFALPICPLCKRLTPDDGIHVCLLPSGEPSESKEFCQADVIRALRALAASCTHPLADSIDHVKVVEQALNGEPHV